MTCTPYRCRADGARPGRPSLRGNRPSKRPAHALTIVVFLTPASTPAASFHPEVVIDGEPTRVMCEMMGAMDARALGERAGHLSLDEERSIDNGLEHVLDPG